MISVMLGIERKRKKHISQKHVIHTFVNDLTRNVKLIPHCQESLLVCGLQVCTGTETDLLTAETCFLPSLQAMK